MGAEEHAVHALEIRVEADVFAARQTARMIAEAAGLDTQDQVRVATALSEVGRDALLAGGARVVFLLPPQGDLTIRVVLRRRIGGGGRPPGVVAATRLLDGVGFDEDGSGASVVLVKNRPATAVLEAGSWERVRDRLDELVPNTPLEELRAQNNELLVTLDELRARQEELLQLNAELAETNRGVMAMYHQLSAELEETNRGVVALYAELDDRRQQLQEVNQAKTRFLRNVSHELRTPVASILGLARLLLDTATDGQGEALDPEQRRQVELVQRSGTDLLGLVNELLDLAKAESGTVEPVPREVDLGCLLAELRDTVAPLVDGTAVTLQVDTPQLRVLTDPALLRQILQNLLGNAVKFTERGRISLEVDHREEVISIAVSDTGIGIPEEEQARVFEEFYQVRGPHQSRVKGTGLGLPYARRLASLLGGELTLSSPPGEGCVFTVTLPMSRPPRAIAGEPRIHRALVIDDDPGFRTAFRSMLTGFAEEIVEAGDAATALVWLRRHTPSVIFLDLRLPGMDGATLLTRLGEDGTLRHVPVVIVTAVDLDIGDVEGCGPVAAAIPKPALTRDLLRSVLARVGPGDG